MAEEPTGVEYAEQGMDIRRSLHVELVGVALLPERLAQAALGRADHSVVTIAAVGRAGVPVSIDGAPQQWVMQQQSTILMLRLDELAIVSAGIAHVAQALPDAERHLWDKLYANAVRELEGRPTSARDIQHEVDSDTARFTGWRADTDPNWQPPFAHPTQAPATPQSDERPGQYL